MGRTKKDYEFWEKEFLDFMAIMEELGYLTGEGPLSKTVNGVTIYIEPHSIEGCLFNFMFEYDGHQHWGHFDMKRGVQWRDVIRRMVDHIEKMAESREGPMFDDEDLPY